MGTRSRRQQFLELDDAGGIQTWLQTVPSLPIVHSYPSNYTGMILFLGGRMFRC